jgi:hypothetical protein
MGNNTGSANKFSSVATYCLLLPGFIEPRWYYALVLNGTFSIIIPGCDLPNRAPLPAHETNKASCWWLKSGFSQPEGKGPISSSCDHDAISSSSILSRIHNITLYVRPHMSSLFPLPLVIFYLQFFFVNLFENLFIFPASPLGLRIQLAALGRRCQSLHPFFGECFTRQRSARLNHRCLHCCS